MAVPSKNWLNLTLFVAGCCLLLYVVFGTSVLQGFRNAGKTRLGQEKKQLKKDALTQIGVIQDRRLNEISGIDSSMKYRDCYWVHNDSGNPAELFLISADGHTLARVNLKGATNVDWEDISVCTMVGKPYICVADVGDNQGKRERCQLYLLEEPDLVLPSLQQDDGKKVAPVAVKIEVEEFQTLDFRYSGGPRNCEAMAIEGNHRSIYLFEKARDKDKDRKPVGIYKLRLWEDSLELLSDVAKRVAVADDRITTGADMHSDGKSLITSNYVVGSKYTRKLASTWERELYAQQSSRFGLPVQRQGEAICFTNDGKSAIVVSEFGNQPIWKIDIQMATEAMNSE